MTDIDLRTSGQVTETYAKVIADSVNDMSDRVTTFQVCFHRFVLAEMNTHRLFSRNSASSRAIPVTKQISKVDKNPALPVVWPAEQKGMQGGADLGPEDAMDAKFAWLDAADDMVIRARRLAAIGVHKSVTNRLLEPFQMHTAVITATDWRGFWDQRCSPLAQPEIRVVAEAMQVAMAASRPTLLHEGQWHLPYIDQETISMAQDWVLHTEGKHAAHDNVVTRTLVQVSTARCARASYETQEGTRNIQADLDLYNRLVTASPWHGSPLEHPCTPWFQNRMTADMPFTSLEGREEHPSLVRPVVGNFLGWRQHRFEQESASV